MDVPEQAFGWELLPMLGALSECHFFALDFEMSGIPHSQTAKAQQEDPGRSRKQTLQQRYTELKQAAEKYQILQVGLTVVNEDRTRGVYEVRPYNMYLSPLVNDTLHIERDVTFQSMATGFVLRHGLNLDVAFRHGIPYLSREESVKAIAMERTKRDISQIADIKLRPDEAGNIAFVKGVRKQVQQWHDSVPRPDYTEIAPEGLGFDAATTLSNFQKRLVHQLVRAEFPDCVTISKPGLIRVAAFDVERESAAHVAKWEAFENKMRTQVGMRWIWEAILGGSLDEIDARVFMRPDAWNDLAAIGQQFAAIKETLRRRPRPVLVGHNVLLDLVFFYKCFLGPLPERVDDFAKLVHRLFPVVVDTKYLATHHARDSHRPSVLADVDAEACSYEFPFIEVPYGHERYLFERPLHEAGYDSFMTARVLIKVAAKLAATGMYVDEIKKAEEKAKAAAKAAAGAAGPRKEGASRFAHEGVYDLLELDGTQENSGTSSKPSSGREGEDAGGVPVAATWDHAPVGQAATWEDMPVGQAPAGPSTDPASGWVPVGGPAPPPQQWPEQHWQPGPEQYQQPPPEQYPPPMPQQYARPGPQQHEQPGPQQHEQPGPQQHEQPMPQQHHQPAPEQFEQQLQQHFEQMALEHQYRAGPPPPQDHEYGPGGWERPAGFPPMIPPWNSDFWRIYGNKLRVNGTVEGVLLLDPKAELKGASAADSTPKPAPKRAARSIPASAKAPASVPAPAPAPAAAGAAKPRKRSGAHRNKRR